MPKVSHSRVTRNHTLHLSLILIVILGYLAVLLIQRGHASAAGNVYYVSRNGTNADGRAWSTAWSDLDKINWAVVNPGDTIYLDGGSSSMTYTSTLNLTKSGTQTQPIYIKLSQQSGHNGKAVIFGGRSTPLPYCGQTSYTYQTSGVRPMGIQASASWITIDGTKWRGIDIHGHNQYGISLTGSSSHITIRNVEVYDNGIACAPGSSSCAGKKGDLVNTWTPDQKGVNLSGSYQTFERALIHDNGQDAFQSSGVNYFTLRDSWIYNSRTKSGDPAYPYNYCTHSDGVQVFNGGSMNGFVVDRSIIGPLLMQGLILGQTPDANGNSATYNNVTITNSLFYGTTNSNIMAYDGTAPVNWTLRNVTSYRAVGANWTNMIYKGSGLTIANSIFYGGTSMNVNSGTFTNNCQYQVGGTSVGKNSDPLFTNAGGGDFSLKSGSACAGLGSSITSSAQLLALPDPQNQVTPTSVPSTSTPVPTTIPTASPRPTSSPTSTPASSLSQEAESAVLSNGFTVKTSGGITFISQPTQTTSAASGGLAVFTFSLPAAGNYYLSASVNAPTTASNSFFINFDQDPGSLSSASQNSLIWDVPAASGFTARNVTWRGSGTETSPQYNPRVFTLSAGQHKLYLRGREANAQLNKLTVVQLASTPTPLPPTPTPTPTPQPIVVQAESGTFTSPGDASFVSDSGSVYQDADTSALAIASAALARYTFSIKTAGNYQINMFVNAATDANNSLFVNLDQDPAVMSVPNSSIWDIIPVTGSAYRTLAVTWRGSNPNTLTPAGAPPKVFPLSAGTHTLYLRGREKSARIDSITIQPYSNVQGDSTSVSAPVSVSPFTVAVYYVSRLIHSLGL